MFSEQGYNFQSISYREDDEFKRLTIEDFSKPDTSIHGLIATDILTRGFDVPDVMIGISARPFTKSFSSHVQQMGRVMRPYPGKEYGIWLDHSGNYIRFQEDWDAVHALGVDSLSKEGEKAKKEPTEKQKKDCVCPKCQALMYSNICVCGYIRPPKSEVLTVPGEMVELNGKTGIEQNRNFFAELRTYAAQKGYKSGWAAHKYKERLGVFPPTIWNADSYRQISTTTSQWIRSRMIAYAKAKAKER
jgi:superfamily II DNA or RNA helicase